MHGTAGSDLRRRVIVAEFVLGTLGGLAIGIFLIASAQPVGLVVGVYAIGVGLNYLPLASHAISLRGRARLRAELRGVDVAAELRRYTRSQFWVFVPFLFLWLEARARRSP